MIKAFMIIAPLVLVAHILWYCLVYIMIGVIL